LRVVSNKERKIKERLDLEIDRNDWRDVVPNIIVPTEKVYKIRNAKR
jgi:transcriptional antiterminator NusG